MNSDPRCCGSGTCIINAEGICWCGQVWDGEKMSMPQLSDGNKKSIFNFQANSIQGMEIPLSNYKNHVLLLVNTASQCGFTPQLKGLENLHKTFSAKGLVVLGFPCNQFGSQEPGSNTDIDTFCQTNYGVSFQMMEKIDVNGNNAHPLYAWLKGKAPGILGSEAIKWNFTKFLVGRHGQVIKRYAPQDNPESIASDIETALANA
jgi:glutathione peroxidase